MATREKTIVFAFPMTTALVADATVTNLTQITLHIPEASPTFLSVFAEVGFQDAVTATGGTITEQRVALRLGAAAYTTITETDDIANSGENMAGVIGPFDFTTHFTTNWTGTSMTCDMQVFFDQNTGTTLGMNNVTAMVYVTYQYDDTAATQIKTVRLPMESLIGALPTAAANFGTNQIPQLTGAGGVLPEAGVTIRDWFLVIEGNENSNNTTTDFTISANIDGGATTTFMNQEKALASDRFCRWIYRPAVPSTTAAHNLQLWASVANKCNHLTVTLYVTYEFTLAGTTRVLNSILIPIELASPLGLTTTAEASRFQRDIYIQEPGSLTLRQSAFRLNYNCVASVTSLRLRAGAQAYRNYTPLANVTCGMFSAQQRIDSGSAQGAGITLARGMVSFTMDGYSTSTATEATNLNGYVILNYESDLSSAGIGAHATTTMRLLRSWEALLNDLLRVNNYAHAIVETNYWIMAAGFMLTSWSASGGAITFDVECLAAEGKGAGYYDIYADATAFDSERACSMIWMRGRDTFKRCPQDADPNRLDIETARDYRIYSTGVSGYGVICAVTRHSHTWTAAGNISGNNAALSTSVRLVRNGTKEVMQEQVLTAGTTAFSFTVYDNTEDYYIDAYQDATHVGRSALAQAV